MERGILAGLAAFRWAAWTWMAIVLLLNRGALARPAVAYGLVAAALGITTAATILLRLRPDLLLRPGSWGPELACGVALVVADGWVYPPGHAFSVAQSLGVAWPLAGVLAAAVASGAWVGAGAGVVMGLSRAGAVIVNGVVELGGQEVLSLTSSTVLYVLAGAATGHVVALLLAAQREVTEARAREQVARALHDGVLQTLAVVERRSEDPTLARLVREQSRRLRASLAEERSGAVDVDALLHEAATAFEEAYGGRVRVVVADDLPTLDRKRCDALTGAVREALANAGKHGAAREVTIFIEPEASGRVFCSVKDDGSGFDPEATPEGFGLSSSIRGRIAEIGGRVEIESRPGGPTEVRMWTA